MVPALEKGGADCAITDPMSAYDAKWHGVVTDVFALRVGYSITFTAINPKLWEGLPEETRAAMTAEVRKMEDNAWTKAEANEKLGLACLTGGDCPLGEAGHATLHEPGEADIAARQAILDGFMLKRWGKRCGADCATAWNGAAGTSAGLTDPTR